MAEALAPHFAERNFDTALVADDSAMLHAFVFPAQALPVRDGTEYLRAEQAVTFRLEGAVIDGFRLGDFAVRPGTELFRTCKAYSDEIKLGYQSCRIIRSTRIQGFLPLPLLRRGAPGRPGGGTVKNSS